MTTKTKKGASMAAEKQKITFERTYKAPLEDVWDLWTTRDGIESWWGPEGFVAKVHKLDLRAGGDLEYSFTATAPEQIEALKGMGVPLTQVVRGTYKEVTPRAASCTRIWRISSPASSRTRSRWSSSSTSCRTASAWS